MIQLQQKIIIFILSLLLLTISNSYGKSRDSSIDTDGIDNETSDSTNTSTQMGRIIGGSELVFPEWFKESFMDFREDAADASKSGKHLMLFFHVAGCPYCKKMLHDNFEQGDNCTNIKKNFDVIAIDVNGDKDVVYSEKTTVSERAFAQVLNVHYTPTLLFMNADNKVVARVNGYRSPREFKTVLNFVQEKAYTKTDLASFRASHIDDTHSLYTLKDDPLYESGTDLKKLAQQDKPLLILFEDKTCDACKQFHKEVFDLQETRSILKKYQLIRLDAMSEKSIVTPDGTQTTPKEWLAKLQISYRPAVLLYSEGKERERVTGLLKSYHFQQLLNYVAKKKYQEFDNWIQYEQQQTQKILKSSKQKPTVQKI